MLEPRIVAWNVAISAFFREGNYNAAQQLFDRMPCPNEVTWSAMVAGYQQNGRPRESMYMFAKMRREASTSLLSSNVISSVLSACGRSKYLSFGQQVHGHTFKVSRYAEVNAFVVAALVDMYGRCGRMGLANLALKCSATKGVVAWSSLISSYVQAGDMLTAVDTFKEMVRSGIVPTNVTLSMMISACSNARLLLYGKQLHGIGVKISGNTDIFVSTALINMYSKCGLVFNAERVFSVDGCCFDCTPPAAMWNAMISGYAANNLFSEALDMLRLMCRGGAEPNPVTMATVLPVCSKLMLVVLGKELHCYAIKYGWDKDVLVGNVLLDMYCKCGKITAAKEFFDMMPEKSMVSWTTMISGLGMQGHGHGAIEIFESMVRNGNMEVDGTTFVALISACSHSGLMEEGLKYFELMTRKFGIMPTEESYGCLVDLLARAGLIHEAKNVIAMLPMKPTANVFGALLGACRIHGNLDDAEFSMQYLHELGQKECGLQQLLSNIYAEAGRRDGFVMVRKKMDETGLRRRKSFSWLDSQAISSITSGFNVTGEN